MRVKHSKHPLPPTITAEMPGGTVREFHGVEPGVPDDPRDGFGVVDDATVVNLRALWSLILTIVGTVSLAVGSGLLWGLGASLAVGGGIAVVVGLLLGVSS